MITDRMYSESRDIWDKLKNNAFIHKMADGSLSEERYINYMLQDYAYLKAYLLVLDAGYRNAETASERDYIKSHITEINEEIERVHIPAMRELRITDEEAESVVMCAEIKNYSDYMLSVTKNGKFIDCISAILACSWSYEYICDELVSGGYVKESEYASWFMAYSSKGYKASNYGLMEKVNEYADAESEEKCEELVQVFKKCSAYELDFWNAL